MEPTALTANLRPRINFSLVTHVKRHCEGGVLTIKKGDVVQPFDVLGKTQINPGFFILDLAKRLGVSNKQAVSYLRKPIGSKIFKGELLAIKPGFLNLGNKIITSPTDCTLDSYNESTGELTIKFLPKEVPILAGVYGIIDDIATNNEIIIRTLVTEVFGVFGSGKQRFGELHVLGKQDSFTLKEQISPEMSSQIIVAGALIYPDAIKRAISIGATGIVCGGLNARDFKSMTGTINTNRILGSDLGISVMATEGFGPNSIGEDIYRLLLSQDGGSALISGNSAKLLLPSRDPDSLLKVQKTIIPVSRYPEAPPELRLTAIETGRIVRVIWPPFMGMQGKIVHIDNAPTVLPSGISTFLLTIEGKQRKIKVPFTNIEIIA